MTNRKLYTDTETVVLDCQRPVVLNGIEELAKRTDLLDRSVLLELPVIEHYREEREFWARFDLAHHRMFGALLDVAVKALRDLPGVRVPQKTRMADFAALATAAESALNLRRGEFMNIYTQNRQDANAVALETSPIGPLICDLAEEGDWEGTATELLRALSKRADEEVTKRRSWPKTSGVLSSMMTRLATALRRIGVDVESYRDSTRKRTRMISIKKHARKQSKNRARTLQPNRRDKP